jgi:hypothetical protein
VLKLDFSQKDAILFIFIKRFRVKNESKKILPPEQHQYSEAGETSLQSGRRNQAR